MNFKKIYHRHFFSKMLFHLRQFLYFISLVFFLFCSGLGIIMFFWHFISIDTCFIESKYSTPQYWNFPLILGGLFCIALFPFIIKGLFHFIGDIFSPYIEVKGKIEKIESRLAKSLRRYYTGYFITVEGTIYEIDKTTYEQLGRGQNVIIKLSKYQKELHEIYSV